jgi:SAM-dependent methyltransferase
MHDHEQVAYEYQRLARGLISREQLEAAFKKMAATYGHYFRRYLNDATGPAVDVACGYGNFLYFLRAFGVAAEGFDLDEGQVALARLLDLPAETGDGLTQLRSRADLGLVSALDFLEHIDKDDAVAFLRSAHGALRSEGLIILRLPSADGPFGAHDYANDLTHRWLATASVMRNLLSALSFKVLAVHDDYPAPVHLKGFLRYATYQAAKRLLAVPVIALGMTPPSIWTRSMWIVAKKV